MADDTNPFTDPHPKEVPLPKAPLVRVLAQIRFPEILAIENKELVAAFQEDLRSTYPVLRQEQTAGVALGPSGLTPTKAIAWRFSDLENTWRVTLTTGFVSLETTAYLSRRDFLVRLRAVCAAMEKHVQPKLVDRIGVRYVDRLVGNALPILSQLIQPPVLGIVGTSLGNSALHSLQETLFTLSSGQLLARWGLLPADLTTDPGVMDASPERSWILDLDMFGGEASPFNVDKLVQSVGSYAEQIHAFFRWATTPEFLKHYGGKLE